MHETLKQLIELTALDKELNDTRAQLQRYPAMLQRMDADEAEARKALDEARQRTERIRHEQRDVEQDVLEQRARISKYLAQQNQVKTNKEYQAITHEIDGLREKIDALETRGLELLEQEEQAGAAIAEAEARMHALDAAHATERARIAEQQTEKQARIERLEAERAQHLSRLDDETAELYEMLEKRHPGNVCVPLEGEHCAGCNWHLVAQVCQAVRLGRELVRCENCKRFVYAP